MIRRITASWHRERAIEARSRGADAGAGGSGDAAGEDDGEEAAEATPDIELCDFFEEMEKVRPHSSSDLHLPAWRCGAAGLGEVALMMRFCPAAAAGWAGCDPSSRRLYGESPSSGRCAPELLAQALISECPTPAALTRWNLFLSWRS